MAELKTRPTGASVAAFLNAIPDATRRRECKAVARLMKEVTGSPPAMWGPSIVGFGTFAYRYKGGRALEWPLAAFSPRKGSLTVYIMPGFDRYTDLLKALGPHSTGKSCLYLRSLEPVDMGALRELVARSVENLRETYGS